MILADEDQVLERVGAETPATPQQLDAIKPPAPTAPFSPSSIPGLIRQPDEPNIEDMGAAAIDSEIAKIAHETAQPGALEGLGHAFRAGRLSAEEVGNFNADDNSLARAYDPVLEAINKGRSAFDTLPNPYNHSPFSPLNPVEGWRLLRSGAGLWLSRQALEDEIWSRAQSLRQTSPQATANIPASKNELLADVLAEQRTALAYGDQLASRSDINNAASFAGQMVGSFNDPPNILAMVFGGPAARTVVGAAVKEGALNTVLDLAGLPSRSERLKRLGYSEPSAGEIGAELAGDFGLGAFLGGGTHALLHSPAPEVRAAAQVVDDESARAAENPHAPDVGGQDLMRQGALSAMNALQDGRADLLPDTRAQLDRALEPKIDAMRRRGGFTVESFDPADIGTDASAMQYKGGADTEGVTDRLAGVTSWDPAKAGISLVWEKNDGGLIIADGHQRLALAKRLSATDDNVNLYGIRYREADGFTAQDMRTIAALKNIAEGTGTGIDAARVLKDAPRGIEELPPRSGLVRQAKDLASLSDDAFGMAINGHASERDAALVGRHVKDPKLQAPILQFLARESPESAEEAELLVRQAMAAGAVHNVQSDMFGSFLKADLILPQRVKILKSALTSLRKDKGLFANVTARAEELRAAGNRTATRVNAANADAAARSLAMLKALAERKGPISDALQAAAESGAKAGTRRGAVSQFLADVRSALERGELDGERPGDAVGDVESEAAHLALSEPGPAAAARQLKDLTPFHDPIEKPEGFRQQAQDLALDLAPPPREAPIVAFRRELATIEQQLPPVPEASTRLWRGNRPGAVGKNPQFTNDAAGIALPFGNAYGGDLSYVDVPTADLEKYLNKTGGAPGAEFTLPPELAAKAKIARPNPASFLFSQKGKSLDELFKDAPGRQAELDRLGAQIAKDTGTEWKSPGVKDAATAAEKMRRKGYADAGQMSDLTRGKFLVTDGAASDEIVHLLAQHFDVLDEGWNRLASGYFDRKLLVRFAGGEIGEVQMQTREIAAAVKAGGREAFKIARDISRPDAERQAALARGREIYSAALAAAPEDLRASLSQAGTGGNSPKVFLRTSSDIGRADVATSPASTSVQGAPGLSTAAARNVDSLNAEGRKSQLPNAIMEPSKSKLGTNAGENKSPFGDAAPEIEAIRRMPQDLEFADPLTDGETTVRATRRRMEKEARAVEALRACMGGDLAI